jgi:hypothetical protein
VFAKKFVKRFLHFEFHVLGLYFHPYTIRHLTAHQVATRLRLVVNGLQAWIKCPPFGRVDMPVTHSRV